MRAPPPESRRARRSSISSLPDRMGLLEDDMDDVIGLVETRHADAVSEIRAARAVIISFILAASGAAVAGALNLLFKGGI
jgi:hypothetical protein